VLPAIRAVVSGHGWTVVKMAAAAFVGGVAEALFLITVTRAAFAITEGNERIGIVSSVYVPVHVALLLALSFVVLRLGFAGYASWHSARLSAQVVADVRNRLASAFLDASWSVQQGQRGGSLQELLTTFSNQAAFLMGAFSQGILASANLVALLAMAIAVDPLGAAVLVTTVGILGLLLRPLRAAVRRRAREVTNAGMEFATSVNEVSQLGLEVHVFQVQEQARSEVTKLVEHTRDRSAHLQFLAGLTAPIYTGLAYLALLGALALVAASNATSLTSLGAAMLVMLRSLSYGQALQSSHTNVSSTTPAIEALQTQLEVFEAGRRSTDGTQDLLAEAALTDSRLRWVDASERPGPAHARNRGVDAALGTSIAFCDADDVVGDGWVAAVAEGLASEEAVTGPQERVTLNPA